MIVMTYYLQSTPVFQSQVVLKRQNNIHICKPCWSSGCIPEL